jgi:hypothetical protein
LRGPVHALVTGIIEPFFYGIGSTEIFYRAGR